MNAFDGFHKDELDGRLRGVLVEVADQLSPMTVDIVGGLIDANEASIALDMVSEMLVEAKARVSREVVDDVARLAEALGLGFETAGRLRPLITRPRKPKQAP